MMEWDGKDPLILLHHVEKIVDKRIQDAIEKHELENSHTLNDIHGRLRSISDQISGVSELVRAGFPDGDPHAHRRVHEHYIREAQDRDQVWMNVKSKMLEGGAWAVLALMAVAIWDYVRTQIK